MISSEERVGVITEPKREVISRHFEKALRHYQDWGLIPRDVQRVLSAGCGQFPEAKALIQVFPQAGIEGVDRDTTFLRHAEKVGVLPVGVAYREADLSNPENFDGPYDLVVVRNPDVHRLEGWKRVFGNIKKSLRGKQGRVLITCSSLEELTDVEKVLSAAELHVIKKESNMDAVPDSEPIPFKDNYLVIAKK